MIANKTKPTVFSDRAGQKTRFLLGLLFFPVLGKLAFLTLLPLFRRYLRRTKRAYVLVMCGGEVLLIKNWLSRQRWQLPGGGIRRGETAEEAATRELSEELSITAGADLKKIAEGVWQTDKLGFRYEIFQLALTKKPPVKILKPELTAAAWRPIEELKALEVVPEVYSAIGKASDLV